MSKLHKTIILVAALVIAAFLAYWLVFAYGNPQWHWKIYAHQAAGVENHRLEPPASYSGEWRNWDGDGRLVSIYSYVNGVPDGPYVAYGPDGSVVSEGSYANGKFDGVQMRRPQPGTTTLVPYVNGVRNGIEKTLYDSGEVAVETPWVDDQQQGEVKVYYPNGQVQETFTLRDGAIDGIYETWHEDGRLRGRQTYRENALHGPTLFWHENGMQSMALNYKYGVMDGDQTWFYADGEKSEQAHFIDGLPHGYWRRWDENGALVSEEHYDMGELKKPDDDDDAEDGEASPAAADAASADTAGEGPMQEDAIED